jgi:predicted MPP superfamily phosphohydrolase
MSMTGRALTRRAFLATAIGGAASVLASAAYGFGFGPMLTPRVARYRVAPSGWPQGFSLEIAALSDLHACDPFMSIERIEGIVERMNALRPDVIVLLGDYVAGIRRRLATPIPSAEWARALSRLSAPLGVHAILGNHDVWDDLIVQRDGGGTTHSRRALEANGVPVYENEVVRLRSGDHAFWLAGLADQHAIPVGRLRWRGFDDLPKTLASITTDDPVILLAHEPDIFAKVPKRVALTLSGHTHGGQMRLMGWSPYIPSRFGNRYGYGHIVEDEKHLVVSGGLGCTMLPVRFGVPPEILHIRVEAPGVSR